MGGGVRCQSWVTGGDGGFWSGFSGGFGCAGAWFGGAWFQAAVGTWFPPAAAR